MEVRYGVLSDWRGWAEAFAFDFARRGLRVPFGAGGRADRGGAGGAGAAVVPYSFTFPQGVRDVSEAVAHFREHGPEYGVDPERIFLIGFSAGGHRT